MIFGYVNLLKGESEEFLEGRAVDNIIFNRGPGFDFSFADKGDVIVIESLKSVCEDLKGMIEFSQFVIETGIDFLIVEGNIDTRNSVYKMMLSIWSLLNQYDDQYFRNGGG